MIFDNFEGETELLAAPEAEPAPANIPATLIAAKVRAAKKGKKGKARAVKAAKSVKKAPAKAPAKKKAAKVKPAKKAVAKAKPGPGMTKAGGKAVRPNAVGKTGRKGWAEKDRVRNGDAAFGKKVAKARVANEWPQWKLAEKVGCTQPAVCNIEKGTAPCGEKLKAKICKVLGL